MLVTTGRLRDVKLCHVRKKPEGTTDDIRWDQFGMAESPTTINENGVRWQYALPRHVVQRSSTLHVLESPRMSLTRDRFGTTNCNLLVREHAREIHPIGASWITGQ
jgi:hypothetical protein